MLDIIDIRIVFLESSYFIIVVNVSVILQQSAVFFIKISCLSGELIELMYDLYFLPVCSTWLHGSHGSPFNSFTFYCQGVCFAIRVVCFLP